VGFMKVYQNEMSLVGGFNPSEKYESQLGWLFPTYGKSWNSMVPNHQSVKCLIVPWCSMLNFYEFSQNHPKSRSWDTEPSVKPPVGTTWGKERLAPLGAKVLNLERQRQRQARLATLGNAKRSDIDLIFN
jgi:hypothetical protein